MCRLLCVRSPNPFEIETHLGKLAEIARRSKEYQGHGWGCAYWRHGEWTHYKNLAPIWEDNLSRFGETTFLLAHARSAFRDEGIAIENNMPFHDERHVFIFNGELRGVRLNVEGRIGAEKIFNLVRQLNQGNLQAALERTMAVLNKRTRYIRAANVILTDTNSIFVASQFSEESSYFTMHYRTGGPALIICSEIYPGERDWTPVANHSILVFE